MEPEHVSKYLGQYRVYAVPKRCTCGAEWTGNSFEPVKEGEPLPRYGMCNRCADIEDAAARASQRRPDEMVKPVEVAVPREPGE